MKSLQTSFRLPVHVLAKLKALQEIYPETTRTQIVSGLLDGALQDFYKFMSPANQLIFSQLVVDNK